MIIIVLNGISIEKKNSSFGYYSAGTTTVHYWVRRQTKDMSRLAFHIIH